MPRAQTRLFVSALTLQMALFLGTVQADDEIVLRGQRWEMAFSRTNGSLVRLSERGRTEAILRGGEHGLWQARLADGKSLDALAFSATSTERSFHWSEDRPSGTLRMTYQSPELTALVAVTPHVEGADFVAEVTSHGQPVEEFALPARLRFTADDVERFICPSDGNQGVGMALLKPFFQRQARATSWTPRVVGAKGYESLFGGPLTMFPNDDPPVEIKLTDEGRRWFGDLRLPVAQAHVNRPPKVEHVERVLVDSAHGPYFSSRRLGDEGGLWRIGGGVQSTDESLATTLVGRTIDRLGSRPPAGRDAIGLLALRPGPAHGSWTSLSVKRWSDVLGALPAVVSGKLRFVELSTVEELDEARSGGGFLAIVNPYGEWLPVKAAGEMPSAVAAIGEYVRRGGNWFEVGGHPFFCELMGDGYFQQYQVPYPPAFADFVHLESRLGSAAAYRIQPRSWQPWQGVQDRQAIFVPGRIGCGADEEGGWCDRAFATYIAPGETWRSPVVRLTVGIAAAASARNYARDNAITRRLEDKMSPELLEKFKRSVLVYYAGDAREKLRHLERLPVPTQVHFADYLHGGFDKQYPDHLPPSPRFGTPKEFREFIDAARRLGHLVVPYTNPTWWCEGPKGPTFEKAGDAPLLVLPDGKVSHERYADNGGFTVCHWHPEVQEANRRTRQQFREEYPADVLFQDQCGARGWRYDLNRASPTRLAYTEGLLSMVDEDSRLMPLSTESGWDRVVNAESQLCGMTWSLVPTETAPEWRQLMKDRYDPSLWEIFPLAQYMAHDKTAMIHHDLGQFVTNRRVLAWTLGLGYSLSYRVRASSLEHEPASQWLQWLDRLQKSVVARYVGQPLDDFRHEWKSAGSKDDDGLLRAVYRGGSLRLLANLGPQPLAVAPGGELPVASALTLAPYGFLVTAPGLVAGHLMPAGGKTFGAEGVSFVAEGDDRKMDVWLFGAPGEEAALLTSSTHLNPLTLRFDAGPETQTAVAKGVHLIRLPSEPPPSKHAIKGVGRVAYLWHAVSPPGE